MSSGNGGAVDFETAKACFSRVNLSPDNFREVTIREGHIYLHDSLGENIDPLKLVFFRGLFRCSNGYSYDYIFGPHFSDRDKAGSISEVSGRTLAAHNRSTETGYGPLIDHFLIKAAKQKPEHGPESSPSSELELFVGLEVPIPIYGKSRQHRFIYSREIDRMLFKPRIENDGEALSIVVKGENPAKSPTLPLAQEIGLAIASKMLFVESFHSTENNTENN